METHTDLGFVRVSYPLRLETLRKVNAAYKESVVLLYNLN